MTKDHASTFKTMVSAGPLMTMVNARRLVVVVCTSPHAYIFNSLQNVNVEIHAKYMIPSFNNHIFQIHVHLTPAKTMERARHSLVVGLNVNVKITM